MAYHPSLQRSGHRISNEGLCTSKPGRRRWWRPPFTFTVAMYMGPILWGPGRKRSVFADCPVLVVLPWEGGKDGFHGWVLKAAAIIYYCHKMAMVWPRMDRIGGDVWHHLHYSEKSNNPQIVDRRPYALKMILLAKCFFFSPKKVCGFPLWTDSLSVDWLIWFASIC